MLNSISDPPSHAGIQRPDQQRNNQNKLSECAVVVGVAITTFGICLQNENNMMHPKNFSDAIPVLAKAAFCSVKTGLLSLVISKAVQHYFPSMRENVTHYFTPTRPNIRTD